MVSENTIDLSVRLGALMLKNPVMPASGTFGYIEEYEEFFDPSRLGAVIPKTVTLKPREGNRPQRVVETASGMLNSIGLQNMGLERFKEEKWPYISSIDTVKIINIAGETIEEFIACAEEVAQLDGVDAVELNISCPNLNSEGKIFGTDAKRTEELVKAVKSSISIPVITKLTPNVTDIVEIANAALKGGSDVLSLTNTFVGMQIDIDSGKPVLGNIRGGLSGPAIKPISLRMVFDTASALDIPVIGMGGIASGRDAVEFLMAGASAVQVGTVNFIDPEACINIINGIEEFLMEKRYKSVDELIGLAQGEIKH